MLLFKSFYKFFHIFCAFITINFCYFKLLLIDFLYFNVKEEHSDIIFVINNL